MNPKDGLYVGEWVDGKITGKCWYFDYKEGDIYKGDWINNIKEGYGVYRHANGSTYDG